MYGEEPTPKELEERALNREVSLKCMEWAIGTPAAWCELNDLAIDDPTDPYYTRALYIDSNNTWRYYVDEEDCECGAPWYPATKLQDAWKAATHMGMTHVSFDIRGGQVECRVAQDTIMCKRVGGCPAEALSKALIAFTEV